MILWKSGRGYNHYYWTLGKAIPYEDIATQFTMPSKDGTLIETFDIQDCIKEQLTILYKMGWKGYA